MDVPLITEETPQMMTEEDLHKYDPSTLKLRNKKKLNVKYNYILIVSIPIILFPIIQQI